MIHKALTAIGEAHSSNIKDLQSKLAEAERELNLQQQQLVEMQRNGKTAVLVASAEVGEKEDLFASSVGALSSHKAELAKVEMEVNQRDLDFASATRDYERVLANMNWTEESDELCTHLA